MIISMLNKKGGVGKSTVARALAVELVNAGENTVLIDTDGDTQVVKNWGVRRADNNVIPEIDVVFQPGAREAIKIANNFDSAVIDGRAYVDKDTIILAQYSDFIIVPGSSDLDDLRPTLEMAKELEVKGGINSKNIVMVFVREERGDTEDMLLTYRTVEEWGFTACKHPIPFRKMYSTASNNGLSITETSRESLRDRAITSIQGIINTIASIGNDTDEAALLQSA